MRIRSSILKPRYTKQYFEIQIMEILKKLSKLECVILEYFDFHFYLLQNPNYTYRWKPNQLRRGGEHDSCNQYTRGRNVSLSFKF